jgi:hypothetical protein
MLPAFLDTCVLLKPYLFDALLSIAEAGLYRPLWSPMVMVELERNLARLIGGTTWGRRPPLSAGIMCGRREGLPVFRVPAPRPRPPTDVTSHGCTPALRQAPTRAQSQ